MDDFSPITDEHLRGLLRFLDGADDYVFLETTRGGRENHRSYLFLEPVARLRCWAGDDPVGYLDELQSQIEQGFYLAGWLAYEFAYALEPVLTNQLRGGGQALLADFGVYRNPLVYDHLSGCFSGGQGWPELMAAPPVVPGYRLENLRLNQERKEYLGKVARIKEYIAAGDTYQVNYTLKLLFDFAGNPGALYETLRRNQSVAYGALLKSGSRHILSFSPELFFRKDGRECLVRPMKGTGRRGTTLEEDRRAGKRLFGDSKNRSENVMIVDLLRNDLGRVCEVGTVETTSLFDIETYETLHQLTSTVRGRLQPEISLARLFQALFPCGSVTGAPKIRTMEIIRELEDENREVYTGAIGFLGPNGEGVFNVPIRTVVLEGARGEMGIGSGIVYDSSAEAEWEECRLKARFLEAPAEEFQLIETLLWQPGQDFYLLELHLERLRNSAIYWGMPFRAELVRERLAEAVALAAGGGDTCLRLRLLLYKDGRVTVEATVCEPPQSLAAAVDFEAVEHLPLVGLASFATDPDDPFLHHKTTRRLDYDRERNEAIAAGCFEVLFVNNRGELTEGSFTNLFILNGNRELLTPPLACGLLNGVLRQGLLSGAIPLPAGLTIREAILHPADLETAEAILVGNSVRGLRRVALLR
jgi:para-aminobenzoate synthetase/4-amino-4-deoxychorismate lyase